MLKPIVVVESFITNCDSLITIEQILIIGFKYSCLPYEGLVDNLMGRLVPLIFDREIVVTLIIIT